MRFVLISGVVVAFFAALVSPIRGQIIDPSATPSPRPGVERDQAVAEIYALVKARNAAELQRRYTLLVPPTPTPSPVSSAAPAAQRSAAPDVSPAATATPTAQPTIDPALSLALYLTDRTTYKEVFIHNYPATVDALGNDYGDRLDRAGITPRGRAFPVDALSGYALDNDAARAALLRASGRLSGPLAMRYSSAIAHIAAARPAQTLHSLALLASPDRLAAVTDPAWCLRVSPIVRLNPTDAGDLAARDQVSDATKRCPHPAAAKRPRHRGARKPARNPHAGRAK